jgi:hypothetical protein
MSAQSTVQSKQKNLKEIESVITKAIKKVQAKKENDICHFLPVDSGGYMHHFTLRKMKVKNPKELLTLIERYIINVEIPRSVAPKSRAPRGSRKRPNHITFSRMQMERMLNIARLAGDKEIISLLSPKKSLAFYKRELINALRQNKVNQDLWNGYVEIITAQEALSSHFEENIK